MLKLSSRVQLTKLSDEVQDGHYAYEAVILSGEPIDYWQRFVVDLSSIAPHKPRLTVDYNHNDQLIIGYGENFHVTPEGLKATGKLIAGTYADEIVKLVKQGVPFEASVVIDLNNAIETRVGADQTIVVNGRTFQGPLSVYAHVPLEGFSICPHGADKFTTFNLLSKEVNFMKKTKLSPSLVKLSGDEQSGEDTSQELSPSVKNQELADFCSMFGDANGLALFQSGADIAEARQWQTLNEKYSKYLSEKAEEQEETAPADPPKESDVEDDKEKLSAVITKLTKHIETQSMEFARLHAALPRGESAPVKHNYQSEQQKTELSEKEKYCEGFNKRFQK
jgi:hypothetical protein